uniref:Uncharacterized protein n=1 Tax=Arundo donax TaxID=35708 RepID=A0A0A8YFY3_ARUDO
MMSFATELICSSGIVFSLRCLFKNKQAHKYPALPYNNSLGTFSVTVISSNELRYWVTISWSSQCFATTAPRAQTPALPLMNVKNPRLAPVPPFQINH